MCSPWFDKLTMEAHRRARALWIAENRLTGEFNALRRNFLARGAQAMYTKKRSFV
jgi:hypothetical protein